MKKEWKDVLGYSGVYEVSSLGKVRTVGRVIEERNGRKQRIRGRVLRLHINGDGYYECIFSVKNKRARLKLARVVWEAFNGPLPKGLFIDHKDRNKTNNHINNLRLATRQQNNVNRIGCPDKTSRYKGVVKRGNRYRAQITHNYKVKYLGTFDTEEEAAENYNKYARKLHGEFFYDERGVQPWVCNNHVAMN